MMYMIRKQLYLTERQDAALKHKALEAGVSEAELVRRALDAALNTSTLEALRPGQAEAAAKLRSAWAEPASRISQAFDRESLYAERINKLITDQDHR